MDSATLARDKEGSLTDERAPTPPADNEYTQLHEVKKGETHGKIAEKYYGDPSL